MTWQTIGFWASIFLGILGATVTVAAWFFRERLRLIEKEADRVWEEVKRFREDHRKYVDWIDQRLHAGSEEMKAIRTEANANKERIQEIGDRALDFETFEAYRDEHESVHEELRRSLDRLSERAEAILSTVSAMEKFVKGNLDAVHRLLSGKVVIKNTDQLDLLERGEKEP